MSEDGKDQELNDLEYLEALMGDFDMTPNDTLGDLIEALREEATDEAEESNHA